MLASRLRSARWPALLLALALPLATSCDDNGDGDAGVDSGPAPDCSALVPYADGDDGAADPLTAPAGEARAGRLLAAAVPEDRTGLGTWAEGDFVIANDRFAMIIEDAGNSDAYDPYGGRPVGVAAVEGGTLVRAGDFNELIFGYAGYLLVTETVSVLNDGSDGNTAVVRARGQMGPLEFAGDLLNALVPSNDFTGLPATMDYELAPGSDTVDIYLNLQQNDPEASSARGLGLVGVFQRFRMPIWTNGGGFAVPTGEVPFAGFIDDGATSYALFPPEGGPLTLLLEQAGVLVMTTERNSVATCADERVPLGSIMLGGPGLPGLQESLARRSETALRTVTGTVRLADGTGTDQVRLHVRGADGQVFLRTVPASDGTFSVELPAEDMELFAYRRGTALVGPIAVASDATTTDVDLPDYGTIRVNVTNTAPEPAPIPARVQVIAMDGAPEIPSDLGERPVRSGRSHVAFATGTAIELPVDPGQHQVIVSRGFEYELSTETVTVAAGEVVEVTAALDRSIETTGVMCADYHIHTHRSPDSPDGPELKLTGAIADGLEIPVRSDHEWVHEFGPVIEDLGLGAFAYGMGGEELTTFAYGHFGVFPLTPDASQPSGGAVPWVGRLPPAVFTSVRERAENPVLIINHPRSGGAAGGYFNAAGWSADTGMAARPEFWDEDFTLVEVFNDQSFEEGRDSDVRDWFGFLNSGRRVFAVGSSDSHNIYGTPVGWPRTCLAVGVDNPGDLTDDLVRDTTADGHSTIVGGVYLTVAGPDGSGPGDEVTGAGENAMFNITVQAPLWVEGTLSLEVIVDGTTTETIVILESDADDLNPAQRFQEDVMVPVAADGSWVVFHVGSDADLSPVHPGRDAFGVSNPMFLRR
ncbi:MAG: CehA/McbA family metallohydrolase [Sandaracinaceae bacterium]